MVAQPNQVTQVTKSELFIVELRTRGWAVGVSRMPEERVLTTIFRLSKKQKNKLQALKVRFYRALDRFSVMRLDEKYVVPGNKLHMVEREFSDIYREFEALRKEIYEDLASRWPEIEAKLKSYTARVGLDVRDIERLRPDGEDFLDMYYTITPLKLSIEQLVNVSEEFEKLARERDEYMMIAERLRHEVKKTVDEVRTRYEEKVRELERTVQQLRQALREQSKEIYRLRLKARELADDAKSIAEFLGDDAVEDLKNRLESLKEFFVER